MLARLRPRLTQATAGEDPRSPGPASRGGMPLGHASPPRWQSAPPSPDGSNHNVQHDAPLMRLYEREWFV